MSIKKKLLEIFTYEETLEETAEQKEIRDEIIKEQIKYDKNVVNDIDYDKSGVEETVKKQVLFVDETFEKKPTAKAKNVEPEKHDKQEKEEVVKYSDREEKRFKPTSFISPVHGIVKEADEVIEYTHEQRTKSESDFVKIRSTAFGDDTQPVDVSKFMEMKSKDESENTKSSVIFQTSEIINMNKRNQVDIDKNVDLTLEEAYKQAGKSSSDSDYYKEPIELFELLDELEENTDE